MPSWVHSEKHMMIAHAVDDGSAKSETHDAHTSSTVLDICHHHEPHIQLLLLHRTPGADMRSTLGYPYHLCNDTPMLVNENDVRATVQSV